MLVSNSTTPSSNFTALRDIGFSVDRNGILTVDDAKLGNAIENNFEEIVTLFGEIPFRPMRIRSCGRWY